MFRLILFIILTAPVLASGVTIAFSGTSLNSVSGISDGDFAVYLAETGNTTSAFSTAPLADILDGISTNSSATYSELSDYEVIGTATVSSGFGVALGSGFNFTLGSISADEKFGILVYQNSTSTTIEDDPYLVFTDSSWVIPSSGGNYTFGGSGDFSQLSSSDAATYSSSVVPEPRSYALLSAFCALTWVVLRRRG